MTDQQRAAWRRLVEDAQADHVYYSQFAPDDPPSAFGRRFGALRLAQCDAILAVDALLTTMEDTVTQTA